MASDDSTRRGLGGRSWNGALVSLGALFAAIAGFRVVVATFRWSQVAHPVESFLVGLLQDLAAASAVGFVTVIVARMARSSALGRWRPLLGAATLGPIALIVPFFFAANVGSVSFWGAYLHYEDLSYLLSLSEILRGVWVAARTDVSNTLTLVAILVMSTAWMGFAVRRALRLDTVGLVRSLMLFAIIGSVSALASRTVRFVPGEPLESNPVLWMVEQVGKRSEYELSWSRVPDLHRHLRDLGARVVEDAVSVSRNVRTYSAADRVFREGHPRPSLGSNVVMVLLESFDVEHLEAAPRFTENFSRFLDSGVHLTRMFTPMHRTAGAEFSALCSLFNPPHYLVFRKYPHARLRCLPKVLKEKGYFTIAVSGDREPSDRERDWLRANAFDVVLSIDDFPEARPLWPTKVVDDEHLYRRAIEEVEKAPKPFFLLVVAQSNHYPYELPPHEPVEPDVPALYQTMRYADRHFGAFYDEMRARFPDTVFVAFGDHGAWFGEGEGDRYQILWEDLNYHHARSRFHVPAGVVHPALEPQRVHRITSLLDLAPTVLSLLGGTFETDFVGESVFDSTSRDAVLTQGAQPMSVVILFDDTRMIVQHLSRGVCQLLDPNDRSRPCLPEEVEWVTSLRQTFMDTTAISVKASVMAMRE